MESEHDSYIDADAPSEEGTEIFARFQLTRNLSSDQKLFGGAWGGLAIYRSLFREDVFEGEVPTTTDVYEFYAPGEKKTGNEHEATGELVNLASGGRRFSEKFFVPNLGGQNHTAIGLFTMGYPTGLVSGSFHYVKIFTFRIKKQQQFVRDFIPAVSSDGKPCMFDKISGKPFYKNAGKKQEFIAGIETLAQLYSLLAKLPDLTGQTQGTLTIRLDASLQTDELRAMIDERGEAKNWEITEAEELEV